MLTEYIHAAMKKARYEILSDDNTFYGEIPGFAGVYANADTLERCRDELGEVLEEWLLFRVSRNLPLPVVDGIKLAIKKTVALEALREIQDAFKRSGITEEELQEGGRRARRDITKSRHARKDAGS